MLDTAESAEPVPGVCEPRASAWEASGVLLIVSSNCPDPAATFTAKSLASSLRPAAMLPSKSPLRRSDRSLLPPKRTGEIQAGSTGSGGVDPLNTNGAFMSGSSASAVSRSDLWGTNVEACGSRTGARSTRDLERLASESAALDLASMEGVELESWMDVGLWRSACDTEADDRA
eukprot:2906825-Rhodomonas_salina.3